MQAKKNTRRKREQPVKRLTLPSLKKSWKELGGKVGVLLLFLFGGYYVFFLGPQLALPNAYLKAQEVFAQHRSNLLENRTALVELARLSATTSDLANKETELLGKLQKTNEDGLVSVESNRRIPFVPGASNEFLDFL
ncbi:MAG: hypothetical protein Q8P55_00730, partial [bacterium]|nr:hypothetical protein [bacterium]